MEHASDHFEDHIQEVQEWLDKNVRLYSNPNKLRLHSFTFDQLNDEGNFCVNFDDEDAETFSFRLGGSDGYTKIYTPAYHYPLGAPASYQARGMVWGCLGESTRCHYIPVGKTPTPRKTPIPPLRLLKPPPGGLITHETRFAP